MDPAPPHLMQSQDLVEWPAAGRHAAATPRHWGSPPSQSCHPHKPLPTPQRCRRGSGSLQRHRLADRRGKRAAGYSSVSESAFRRAGRRAGSRQAKKQARRRLQLACTAYCQPGHQQLHTHACTCTTSTCTHMHATTRHPQAGAHTRSHAYQRAQLDTGTTRRHLQ